MVTINSPGNTAEFSSLLLLLGDTLGRNDGYPPVGAVVGGVQVVVVGAVDGTMVVGVQVVVVGESVRVGNGVS